MEKSNEVYCVSDRLVIRKFDLQDVHSFINTGRIQRFPVFNPGIIIRFKKLKHLSADK